MFIFVLSEQICLVIIKNVVMKQNLNLCNFPSILLWILNCYKK